MKNLVKRYKSRKIQFELRKFRNGYCVVKLINDNGEWVTDWRHSAIRGLDRASRLMFEYLIEAESEHPFLEFDIYSTY